MALTTKDVYPQPEDKQSRVTDVNPASLPQVGDEAEVAGRSGYVTKVVKNAEGLELTVRVQDDATNRTVGVPQTVDPQAYKYEGVDDDYDDDYEEEDEDPDE